MGIIDDIVNGFKNMIISIPKPKLPHISVKKAAGVSVPYLDFDLSWYKKGGVFNGPSVIGVAESGPEAVVPLQGSRMKPFAREIAGQMNGESAITEIHNYFTISQLVVREEADIEKISHQLFQLQQRESRFSGR
ncbi:hypothetical protein [Thermoactinomyces sp. DSM 45892]|uniref:hypothetical protein n=1 Tax=Thermoactinomyces sp. DSM 45892 TaxID=1882753 RepID=UPI000899BAA9|nr:hypothetical protein [Thermoactinomyces sp. DSM 45892]SDY12879.1 hypothetical protein SAMN05444416_10282 [Thermoactinomyces sp. DSM 45892]